MWPRGLEGRPAGHGGSGSSYEQQLACREQNHKNQKTGDPSLEPCSRKAALLLAQPSHAAAIPRAT